MRGQRPALRQRDLAHWLLPTRSAMRARRSCLPSSAPSASTTAAGASAASTSPAPRPAAPARAPPAERLAGRDRHADAAGGQHLGAGDMAGEGGDIVGGRLQTPVLSGRADLDDDAVLHDGDAVAEADGLVEIMGDEDDGLGEHALQAKETRSASRGGSAVEGGERFVEEPQRRLGGEASGRCDALLLPPESSRG